MDNRTPVVSNLLTYLLCLDYWVNRKQDLLTGVQRRLKLKAVERRLPRLRVTRPGYVDAVCFCLGNRNPVGLFSSTGVR